jgi:hypothetical protein
MSIDRVRAKIESLRNKYPSDFRVMMSPEDIRKNKLDVLNSELHGPFNFEDMQFTEIIEKALIAGKQVSLQSGGQNKVLVFTAKSGGKLFDVQQSSKDEMVFDIQGKLEELHDRYIGNDGTPLLLGGLDSYIYQEKFAGIAKQYGFPKYKSYDIADKSILDEVKRRLEGGQTVIVIAWTKEDRMDVYVEPQHLSSQSDSPYSLDPTASPITTNNGISVLAAIGTFILSSLFLGVIGGGFVGYCCFPIILAVAAYFVTPMVIKSLKDFEWRNEMNDSRSLSSLLSLETEAQGLPDIKPEDKLTPIQEPEREMEGHSYRIGDLLDEVLVYQHLRDDARYPFTVKKQQWFFEKYANEYFVFDGDVGSIFVYISSIRDPPASCYVEAALYSQSVNEVLAERENLGEMPDQVGRMILNLVEGVTPCIFAEKSRSLGSPSRWKNQNHKNHFKG